MNPISRRILRIRRRRALAGNRIARDNARAIARVYASLGPATGTGPNVLIGPPGAGNIGDQALIEAFFEQVSGPVVVIARDAKDVVVPAAAEDRVEVVQLSELLYGIGAAHRKDVEAFAAIAHRASGVSIIGADIMDGRYSVLASVNRSSLAAGAARGGTPARVLGFSFAANPKPEAVAALIEAGTAGVALFARDPATARRLSALSVPNVTTTADIVFTATTVDDTLAAGFAAIEDPIALVNVSGLIAKDIDQTSEYKIIVDGLLERGFHVILLPHVSRPKTDDILACKRVLDVTAGPKVSFVPTISTPAQIRGLAAKAALTVTGRMHLSIMSMMNGVPAITLATQGKVEGLMEMFGHPELCVEPKPGLGAEVLAVVAQLESPESTVRADLVERLPGVLATAGLNFTTPLGVAARTAA